MKTLTLDRTTYEVTREGQFSIALKGPRGAKYVLVQNQKAPNFWALTPANTPVKTTWFVKLHDGTFTRVNV